MHADRVTESGSILAAFATNRDFVLLRPTLMTVSSERIKQGVWRELGLTPPWVSKIHLVLYPAMGAENPITLVSERFRDGWQYRLEMPDLMERSRFVRAMVQVVLLEYANRGSPDRSVELPVWLVEGITAGLQSSKEMALVLAPPRTATTGLNASWTYFESRREHPLSAVHEQLRSRPPLTFEELSWPLPEDLEGDRGAHYRACAQLFTRQLLGLKDGRACLRRMLEELPRHQNWQFAFLRAFGSYFDRPLHVEKWWALESVYFTGRDLDQTWPETESWRKLDQVLSSEMQVAASTNSLPAPSRVTLQDMIRGWDRVAQMQALQARITELDLLAVRVATNVYWTVADYRQALAGYLEANRMTGPLPPPRKKPWPPPRGTEDIIRVLDELDRRRMALAPQISLRQSHRTSELPDTPAVPTEPQTRR